MFSPPSFLWQLSGWKGWRCFGIGKHERSPNKPTETERVGSNIKTPAPLPVATLYCLKRPRAAGRQHLNSLHCSLSDPRQICWVGSYLNQWRRWSHKMSREYRSSTYFPTDEAVTKSSIKGFTALHLLPLHPILFCEFCDVPACQASVKWWKMMLCMMQHEVNHNFWVSRWHPVVVTPLCY